MKGNSQQFLEQLPLQLRQGSKGAGGKHAKNQHRSGTACGEYKHEDSLYRFTQAAHEESMPLRRRHVPLPPSGQQSYHATTSSNLLLGSHSAMQSSTSSLQPAHNQQPGKKKKLSQKRSSMAKGSNGVVILAQASSASARSQRDKQQHLIPPSHYNTSSVQKENSQAHTNHSTSKKHQGSISHRMSERTPAGPQSQHPPKHQLPKSQSGKRHKQSQQKKAESAQEKKLHALQLQFMQETLSKLQIEKQNRAQALNKALSRQNNNVNTGTFTTQSAARNSSTNRGGSIDFSSSFKQHHDGGHQQDMLRRSRCDSVISAGSRKSARSRTSTSESRSKFGAVAYNNLSKMRMRPRLCELQQLEEDSQRLNQSEVVIQKAPSSGKQQSMSQRGQQSRVSSEKHNGRHSSKSSNIKQRSSRSTSSRGGTNSKKASKPQDKPLKPKPAKSTSKLPRADNSEWKKMPMKMIDNSLKRRQAKIVKMEQEYIQRQIESTPALHMQDISEISNNTTQAEQLVYMATQDNQAQLSQIFPNGAFYAPQQSSTQAPHLVFVQPRESQNSMASAGYPQDMFGAPKIVFTDDDDQDDDETEVGDQEDYPEQEYCEQEAQESNGEEDEAEVVLQNSQQILYHSNQQDEQHTRSAEHFSQTNHQTFAAQQQQKVQVTKASNQIDSHRDSTAKDSHESRSNMPLQMMTTSGAQDTTSVPRHHQSHQVISSVRQSETHLQSATDEKHQQLNQPQLTNHIFSQVTMPQVQSIGDVNSSLHEIQMQLTQHPHLHNFIMSQESEKQQQAQQPAAKHSSNNKDQRVEDCSEFTTTAAPSRAFDLPRKYTQEETEADSSTILQTRGNRKEKDQSKIVSFFEQEYKNAQKELLTAKSELYEQKFKTDVLKKRVAEYEQVVEGMTSDMQKLQEENKELKSLLLQQTLRNQQQQDQIRATPTAQHQQLSYRSGSAVNYRDATTQRSNSCIQSDRGAPESSENTQEVHKIKEENQQLSQQNAELIQKLDGLQSAQKSQEVLIQYLQGTQNSILQKMQHQMIKSQFTQNLVETAQLATSFIASGDKNQSLQGASNTNNYTSTVSQVPSSSLDLQQFIALRKEDIGTSIQEYFKRTNEAAGLSSEKKANTTMGQQENTAGLSQGLAVTAADRCGKNQSCEMMAEQQRQQQALFSHQNNSSYFGSGLILPGNDGEDTGKVVSQTIIADEDDDDEQRSKGGDTAADAKESEGATNYERQLLKEQQQMHEESSILHEYDSKTFSENNQQKALQKCLNGISPVTNLRRTDSRRSLSYQKNMNNSNAQQHSLNKANNGTSANNDVSVISLSQVNSNSKYMVPKQMRQLLRKHSSEDGEIEDYLQTGAFEKRSNEMRLFSLDGTAQQDIQNMIELSQSNCNEDGAMNSEKQIVLSTQDDPNNTSTNNRNQGELFQQNQLMNLVQHMEEPLFKVRSPEILNQMRQKIIFSGELQEDQEKEDAEESQLSSPEMNCTQTDSNVITTNNASMLTKEQREIQAIIATTKQFTCGSNPNNQSTNKVVPQPMLQQHESSGDLQMMSNTLIGSQNLHLQDNNHFPHNGSSGSHASQIEPPVKSPQFNQMNNVQALKLPILSKETSPKLLPEANASQEISYCYKTQNSMQMINTSAASARPHSTCKVTADMMIKNEQSDEGRSCTTTSAILMHNITRKKQGGGHHRKNNPSLTSHDTVPVDYYLLQRENTHGSSYNMSGLPMATGTLSHMPTEQYMPTQRLTSSFQLPNHHNQNNMIMGGAGGVAGAMNLQQQFPSTGRNNANNSALAHQPQYQIMIGSNGHDISQTSVHDSTYSPFKTHQPGQLPKHSGVVNETVVIGGPSPVQNVTHQVSSGRRPHNFSQSRSTSPNQNTYGGSSRSAHQQEYHSANSKIKDLASSSERIVKRTKKMKEEIVDIDRDIALLHNVINR